MFRLISPLIVAVFLISICSVAYGQGGFGEADANQDRHVDAKELKQYVSAKLQGFEQFDLLFKELDTDKDNAISEIEFKNRMEAVQNVMGVPSRGGNPTEPPKPQDSQRPSRRPAALKVGDLAPTFKLKSLDGKMETDLASFRGKKPVVLIFGSYT